MKAILICNGALTDEHRQILSVELPQIEVVGTYQNIHFALECVKSTDLQAVILVDSINGLSYETLYLHPVAIREKRKNVFIHTFGAFEVQYKGTAIKFSRSRAKELLAYLVSKNGRSATCGELIGILWEDYPPKNASRRLQDVYHSLVVGLSNHGIENILVKSRNSYSVDPKRFDCDYYDYIKNPKTSNYVFNGEFITQYSWAEETLAYLTRISRQNNC